MMRHRVAFSVLVLVQLALPACGPGQPPSSTSPTPASASPAPGERLLELDRAAHDWVDSVLATLDTRRRAAQLVMPWMWGRYVPDGSDEWERFRSWVEDVGVGGVITSIGPPLALGDKLNRLQRLAEVPLLVSSDLEAGPGMRLDGGTLLPYGVDLGGGTKFPPAMAVGATGDPSLAYEMGRITAIEGRAVGIHVTFAPVVDVNNNPANPIINVRSYGGDPAHVAEFAVAHLQGLQDHGMLATAKHFPGHGDVEADTHLAPLILRITAGRADSVELVPYRAAIDAGVAGVMSAHIAFPALAGDSTRPATLSSRMLDSLLVEELGFRGLVITDALDMGAIVRAFGAGEAAVLALEAGADILLQPVDPAETVDAVVAAVEEGRIPPARLERSVRKVLEYKARVGLHRRTVTDLDRIAAVVGDSAHRRIADSVAARSITLARDRAGLVPLVPEWHRRVLLVRYVDVLDPFSGRVLARELAAAVPELETVRFGPEPPPASTLDSLVLRGNSADLVILAVDAGVRGENAVAIDSGTAAAFRAIAARRPTILVSLRSPYLIREVPGVGAYVLAWSGIEASQHAVAEALLGRAPIAGRLPIEVPPMLARGAGFERHVAHAAPASAALDSLADAVRSAIAEGVTPGAVVAVGTSRGPVWAGAFGRTDWDAAAPATSDSTVYDLASLTKVVGTTSAVMRLVDQGRMELDAPLSAYLPGWPTGGWRNEVTIRRLLMHRGGLPPFIRFWHPSEGGLRGRDAILEAIFETGADYAPGSRTVYSDLGAILLGAAVEAVAGMPLDAYLEAEVWTPLGMDDTGFNPLGEPEGTGRPRVALDRIAPTEVDTIYRMTHVHGEVHDENAWAMGGVAGHAGLFSSASDLARFALTLLRTDRSDGDGPAGTATVAEFTARQPGTDRALGWDAAAETRIAEPLSATAFGHTGFTGTSLWVDPDRDLYVVLLTNRVNPTRAQGGIQELRRAVHEWAARAVDGQGSQDPDPAGDRR